MHRRSVLILGLIMIASGLLGASLTFGFSGASAQNDDTDGQHSPAHERMHDMMDAMMGAGFSERMHAQMPGSEAMMEACAGGMQGGGMMNDTMDGMMGGR